MMSEWAAQPDPRTSTMGLLLCREMGWLSSPLFARCMPLSILAVMRFLLGSLFRVRLAMRPMSLTVSPSLAFMVSAHSFSAGHSVKAGASGLSLQLLRVTSAPERTVPCKVQLRVEREDNY